MQPEMQVKQHVAVLEGVMEMRKSVMLKCGNTVPLSRPVGWEQSPTGGWYAVMAAGHSCSKHRRWDAVKIRASRYAPSLARIEEWQRDGYAKSLDGCRVEPDGTCPHGLPSWPLVLGMI